MPCSNVAHWEPKGGSLASPPAVWVTRWFTSACGRALSSVCCVPTCLHAAYKIGSISRFHLPACVLACLHACPPIRAIVRMLARPFSAFLPGWSLACLLYQLLISRSFLRPFTWAIGCSRVGWTAVPLSTRASVRPSVQKTEKSMSDKHCAQ